VFVGWRGNPSFFVNFSDMASGIVIEIMKELAQEAKAKGCVLPFYSSTQNTCQHPFLPRLQRAFLFFNHPKWPNLSRIFLPKVTFVD
jgi:hypothetical protein